jgi:hypothetical protein
MTVDLTLDWILTDSRHGVLVLVNRADDSRAYGPSDIVEFPPSAGGLQPAGLFVKRLGAHFTGKEREAVKFFLRKWPDGPQLD